MLGAHIGVEMMWPELSRARACIVWCVSIFDVGLDVACAPTSSSSVAPYNHRWLRGNECEQCVGFVAVNVDGRKDGSITSAADDVVDEVDVCFFLQRDFKRLSAACPNEVSVQAMTSPLARRSLLRCPIATWKSGVLPKAM